LPGILHLDYNKGESLKSITAETACVIAETIQAEAGVMVPDKKWMKALRKRCTDTGTLLVLDEIQCGFGRNGTLWAFEQFDIVPDVVLLGKALGGGMPLGAFIANKKIMDSFTTNPVLGHINTFGGHPVCCAAGKAAMEVLLEENLINDVLNKEKIFLENLNGSNIKNIRSRGLMIALEFEDFEQNKKVIDRLLAKGIFTDWFLFASQCLRIVPPLIISIEEIQQACKIINEVISDL
jgi:acetylornithine/N-succinyldiaminopimelate aminotransferase